MKNSIKNLILAILVNLISLTCYSCNREAPVVRECHKIENKYYSLRIDEKSKSDLFQRLDIYLEKEELGEYITRFGCNQLPWDVLPELKIFIDGKISDFTPRLGVVLEKGKPKSIGVFWEVCALEIYADDDSNKLGGNGDPFYQKKLDSSATVYCLP